MAEQKRTRTNRNSRKRRGNRILAQFAGATLYVLIIISISAVLATVAWSWAGDVLAFNKEPVTAIVDLPAEVFTEETVQVEKTDEEGTVSVTEKTVKRADLDYVADVLEENGLIKYKFLFKIFAQFTGADTELSVGSYELNSEMDYNALCTNMGRNSSTKQTVKVTIPEGYNIDQIFALLEENGVASVEDLQEMAATHDYKFEWLVPLEIPLGDYHRLEGFLFPDTYEFYIGHDPLYVLNKMLQRFDSKIMEYLETINAGDYDLYEIVTIASLIEKETDGTDHATISSVIYNRLTNNAGGTYGYLQIDATLVYINGGRTPIEEDKTIDSPYNTYLYTGLPAGPIACPGMESLYAAIKPESTKYYFYVLNPETGRHEFTRTYDEHLKLVNKYAQ